jgi:ABC-type hemin transport system ATPase subunit
MNGFNITGILTGQSGQTLLHNIDLCLPHGSVNTFISNDTQLVYQLINTLCGNMQSDNLTIDIAGRALQPLQLRNQISVADAAVQLLSNITFMGNISVFQTNVLYQRD